MIWKAVATCSGPILLSADSFTFRPLQQVAKFRFTIPPPKPTNKKRKPRPSKVKLSANPLIWLLASRQIYAEARPVFYANVSLRFDDIHCLAAFMFQSPEPFIKPSMVQSLSLDLNLPINADVRDKFSPEFSDHCDGFYFARSVNHGWERLVNVSNNWWRRVYICMCPFCYATSSSMLANSAEHFTALRELRLRISVGCTHGEANERRMVGRCGHRIRFGPGGRRFGKLLRPRDADSLVCKDDSEQIAAGFVEWLCTQVPLRSISKVKLNVVDVRFSVEKIIHDGSVGRGGDRCWCEDRTVDRESIESCGFAEKLKRRLMNGDSEEDG